MLQHFLDTEEVGCSNHLEPTTDGSQASDSSNSSLFANGSGVGPGGGTEGERTTLQGPSGSGRSDYIRRYQREWIARRRKLWFGCRSCIWCGSKDRLELDHINPEQKVANCIWSWSRDRQRAEMAKCRVLCYACHKLRHSAAHGTRACYRNGCRCHDCRGANARAKRLTRANKRLQREQVLSRVNLILGPRFPRPSEATA